MRVIKAENYQEMCRKAANLLSAQVILKPNSVLGLATGSTPIGIYERLAEMNKSGDIDFSETVSFNLDEYVGLGPDNPQSYRWFMNDNLFRHINILPENTSVPNGLAADTEKECERYEAAISQYNGIDMQLLGLGHNGHIGFNEPGTEFKTMTHCVSLTESTIQANKRFFENEEDVPRFALTMGIRTIMQARRVILVVSGEGKAQIVKEAFGGPVTPLVPASVLQLHSDFVLIGDADALKELMV